MQYDKFFEHVRSRLFAGAMTSLQVSGLQAILERGEAEDTPLARLAYMLATAYHETGRAMQPIIETRNAKDKTNPTVDAAIRRLNASFAAGTLTWVSKPYWRKDANGKSWLGRGFVQLTHEVNYRKLSGPCGVDLFGDPDAALTMGPALTILFEGMTHGMFTGRPLSDYISGTKADYRNARRVINGIESAEKVAGYAFVFEAALIAGGYAGRKSAAPAPKPVIPDPVPAAPVPAVAAAKPKTGAAVFLDMLNRLFGRA